MDPQIVPQIIVYLNHFEELEVNFARGAAYRVYSLLDAPCSHAKCKA